MMLKESYNTTENLSSTKNKINPEINFEFNNFDHLTKHDDINCGFAKEGISSVIQNNQPNRDNVKEQNAIASKDYNLKNDTFEDDDEADIDDS